MFNLHEWLKRRLRDKIRIITRRALQLVLQRVAGKRLTWRDYVSDPDLELGWLTEFTFRVHPGDRFTEQEVFGDGSVERKESQQEREDHFPSHSLTSPSDPDRYLPSFSPSLWSLFTPELKGEMLVRLGPQAVCDVIAACFGRGDTKFDKLCVWALEKSVARGVFGEALTDDFNLFWSAKAREDYWEKQREGVVSSLWGFPGVPGDLYQRQELWNRAGFLRAYAEQKVCSPPREKPEERVPGPPSPSSS